MAEFCSKCGAQMAGNERFCAKCGNDTMAAAPAAAVAPVLASAAAPVAQPMAPPPPVYAAPPPPPPAYSAPPAQGYAPPPAYGAPGPVPMMGLPPQEAPKKNNTMWIVIAIVVAGGGWYYYHNHQPQTPAANPPTQPQTAPQPAAAPQPGTPPPAAAPAQPGGPGPGGPNATLVQQQQWSGQDAPANGYVQVSNGQWTNGSTVAIESSVLECDQYDANNTVLAQNQTNLTLSNPPLAAGGNATFNPFNVGQIVQNVNSVNCGIVAVTPAQ